MRLEKKPTRKLPTAKLFIAFELPMDLKRILYANNKIFKQDARNIRFVEPEQMHMTIKFLGNNISDKIIRKITPILNQVAQETYPINIEVNKLRIGFPHQMIPKLIFYNITTSVELNKLYGNINKRLKVLDIPDLVLTGSLKKDVYHISIARLKHQLNRTFIRKLRSTINLLEFDPLEYELNEFTLISSIPNRSGIIKYNIIERFHLKNT